MNSEDIRLAIRQRLTLIVNEEIENAQKRAYQRMREAVTAISLEIAEWYSIHDMGNHLEIRVSKMEETK